MLGFLYFLLVFVALAIAFTVLLFLVHNFSGWQHLEIRFKLTRRIALSSKSRKGTLKIKSFAYRNMVLLEPTQQGLLIKPVFYLLFHKRLFLPFSELEHLKAESTPDYVALKPNGYPFSIQVSYFVWEELQRSQIAIAVNS